MYYESYDLGTEEEVGNEVLPKQLCNPRWQPLGAGRVPSGSSVGQQTSISRGTSNSAPLMQEKSTGDGNEEKSIPIVSMRRSELLRNKANHEILRKLPCTNNKSKEKPEIKVIKLR